MSRLSLIVAALMFAGSAAQSDVFAAELKVWSGNGPKAAVQTLCAQFEKATGHKIDLRFAVNTQCRPSSKPAKSSMSRSAIRRPSMR